MNTAERLDGVGASSLNPQNVCVNFCVVSRSALSRVASVVWCDDICSRRATTEQREKYCLEIFAMVMSGNDLRKRRVNAFPDVPNN